MRFTGTGGTVPEPPGAPPDGSLLREENRRHHRYSVTCELRGKSLKPIGHTGDPSPGDTYDLHGVVTDISAGGLGVFLDDSIEIWNPFVCEIVAPNMPIGIPTLLRVLWVLKDGQGHSYRAGLQYLL